MTDPAVAAVAARIPSILDERLSLVVQREPITVRPLTSLAVCLRLIQGSGKGDSVLVVDPDERLLGVLAERDVFAELVGPGVDLDRPVEALMNATPHTFRPDQTVGEAMELMQSGRYRNVPMVDDDGRLVGVVRQHDLLRFLAESFPEEVLNLPPRPHQQMEEPEGA